jgi:hydroxymethylpyrimidine/phosphomethylpyrimidine kinase
MTERLPAALTIAGSDSSGGAGIQADLKTFAANGAYGASVIVALTAQNTTGVQGVHLVPADFVSAQLNSVFSDLNIVALKTGMLATAEIIEVVAGRLAMEADAQVVVDPVMVATSGDRLLADDAVAAMRSTLVPCADLITPNLHEAAVLLDTAPARTREEAAAQGRELLKFGCRGVLMKGGHGSGLDAADCLVLPDRDVWFTAPRVETTEHARNRLHIVRCHCRGTDPRPRSAVGDRARQRLSDQSPGSRRWAGCWRRVRSTGSSGRYQAGLIERSNELVLRH